MTPVTPTSSNRKLTSESNELQEHECDRDRCQTVECACADTSPACVAPPSEIVDVSDHGCAKRGREWGDVEWRGTTPTSDSCTEHIRSSSRSRTHADDEKIVDGLDVKSSQPEDAEGTSATMGIQPARAERTPSPGSSDATYYSNGDAKELSISCHLHPQGTPSETDDPQVVPSLLKSRSATDGCALEVQGISPEGAQIELSVPVLDSPI